MLVNARGNIDQSNSPAQLEIKDRINKSLWLFVEVFMKVMNGLVMRFLCVWLLYYVSNFADSRMKVPRYRWSPISWDLFFFLSVFSSSEVLAKITSIRSKLPTAACWSLGKREETVKPTCFMWKASSPATSVPQKPKTNHSQCSSPVEALNLIVESESQPFELHNSTIELHALSRRKKSLQSYCSVDFDFLAFMRFDMTFIVKLRDDSSFGKLTNPCN